MSQNVIIGGAIAFLILSILGFMSIEVGSINLKDYLTTFGIGFGFFIGAFAKSKLK